MNPKGVLGYGRQYIDDDDLAAVAGVLKSDFLTQGPTVERFEAALAERVGARYAVAVANGTAALHIACLAAGLGPGDRGVTQALTFVASANCLLYCGAEADLVDIDPDSLIMAPRALKRLLAAHPETKVVIPVHFGGLAQDADVLRSEAGSRIVIEDASHALGGVYPGGRPIGCCDHADMTVFSFHPVKPITTGEGGAVTTNDPELYRRLRMLRNHGIERDPACFEDTEAGLEEGQRRPWYYEQQILGFNYRLTDIQAILGLTQLGKLDSFVARRRAIARYYDSVFDTVACVRPLQASEDARRRSGLHLYLLWVDYAALGLTRKQVMEQLRARGVGSQVHYVPVYRQPFHRRRLGLSEDRMAAEFPVTEEYYRGCLTLPLHPSLTDEDVERVVSAVADVVGTQV